MKKWEFLKKSAETFHLAIENCSTVPDHFRKAIGITARHAETCSRISFWRDGLWEFAQEFLNSKPSNLNDEYFIQACALLQGSESSDQNYETIR